MKNCEWQCRMIKSWRGEINYDIDFSFSDRRFSTLGYHVTSSFSKIKNYQSVYSFSFIKCKTLLVTWPCATQGQRKPDRGRMKFVRCVTLKWQPDKVLEKVKRWVNAEVFANWTVFALEELLNFSGSEL